MKQQIYVWMILLLLLTLITSCSSPELVTDTSSVERSFQVSDREIEFPSVELKSMTGDLQIVIGEAGQVQVFAELVGIGTNQESARNSQKSLFLNFSQEGDTIQIVGDRDIMPGIEESAWINYIITIPPNTTLDIQMDYDSSVFSGVETSSTLFVVLLITSGGLTLLSILLWVRLRKAQTQIQKLVFALRAAQGEAHMKDLERKWSDSKKH